MHQLFMLGGAMFAYSRKPRFQTLLLNAEPGAQYRLDGHVIDPTPEKPDYCAWIEDERTHATVSGSKECHNPPQED